MASSTTSPMASTSASSVSVLMENPNSAISANVPIRLTGMVTSGMMDARSVRKNTKITSATSTTASKMVLYTAWMERSMNTELSLATSTVIPGGRSARTLSRRSRTAADSTSGLAVAWRITPSETASRPFRRTEVRSSCAPSRTRATSSRRMGWPFTVLMVICLNSPARCKSVAAVTLNSRWPLSMRPAGTSRLLRRSASSTSCTVRR